MNDHNNVCGELDKKANKSDLEELDMRLMQLKELLAQLADKFADKEVCRKKFKDLYDKVSSNNRHPICAFIYRSAHFLRRSTLSNLAQLRTMPCSPKSMWAQ